jgi:hypothetical protein
MDDNLIAFTSKMSISALQKYVAKHIKIMKWEHDHSTKSGVITYHHKEQVEFDDEVSYAWIDNQWKMYAEFYDGYDIVHSWLGIWDIHCHTKKRLLEALANGVVHSYISFVFQNSMRYGPFSILHQIVSAQCV